MGRVRASSRPLRGLLATLSAGALVAAAAGCAGAAGASSDDITIAYQPGIGYAPLLVAKEQGTLEKKFPDKKITWRVLNSGSAIRDGIVSRNIQVGAGGLGPFIVGASNGIPWKIFIALDNANLQLMSKTAGSLAELKGAGKIAMPGPDSIQSVVLRKAAAAQLGDAKVLDKQIVAMGHPDGLQALLSGQIAGHLTAPPYQMQALKSGARSIVRSYDVFGEHTFNGVYTTVDFHKGNADFIKGLQAAVASSVKMLEDDPDQAAALLSKETGGKESAAELKEQITRDDITYSTKPLGYLRFAQFMKEVGLIEKTPAKPADYFFDNQYTKGGS
ncbi:ABC transporter substrate-binding protein [Actinomadura sp. KC345]|uniref:ABC transporter substrate-binding protein n=1 Tax=Actinomadura sp. KC345 TaxID=2530371 RepID=UPI001042E15D|nr:ABC transporter substrate-binding protein [Actinomadura sp. KC345]TDC51679.1 ABC transporter substrate-binding protein [Actinomadura sp. KC345]